MTALCSSRCSDGYTAMQDNRALLRDSYLKDVADLSAITQAKQGILRALAPCKCFMPAKWRLVHCNNGAICECAPHATFKYPKSCTPNHTATCECPMHAISPYPETKTLNQTATSEGSVHSISCQLCLRHTSTARCSQDIAPCTHCVQYHVSFTE